MEGMSFCSQCGAKLNPNAKFCHSCGAKMELFAGQEEEHTQDKQMDNDSVSQKLYNQYHDIICDKVISAYCNQAKPSKQILYQNGVSYGFSNEMVDDVVGEQEQQIEQFVKHLERLYINGSLLFPDCTWAKENECVDFGINLGFCEDDSSAIYKSFVRKNHLEEKNYTVFDQVDYYERNGMFQEWKDALGKYSLDDDGFYKRFVDAVGEFANLQESLHKQSGSMELSEKDIETLYQKAEELGIYDIASHPCADKDVGFYMIERLITGTEIKLGYTVRLNEERLSSIIPFKKVKILGEEICFESSYFLGEYIQKTFTEAIDEKKNKFIEILSNHVDNIDDPDTSEVIGNCGEYLRALWEDGISVLYKNLNIPDTDYDNFCKDASEKYMDEWFDELGERFEGYAECFDMIDQMVEIKVFQDALKRAGRGTFSGGGLGLKGALAGAVTATALNAGVGAVRGLANKISETKTKNKSTKCKLLVYKQFLEKLSEALESLWIYAMAVMLRHFCRENTIRYMVDYKVNTDRLYAEYNSETDEEKKKSLALQLLKLNADDIKYYLLVMEHIFKEPGDKIKENMASLYKIASFFDMDSEKLLSDFVKQKEDEIKSSYSKKNIKRCEALLKLEAVIGGKSNIRENIFGEFFANGEEFKQKEYTPEELQGIVKRITEYGKRFSYSTEKIVVQNAKVYWKYCWKKSTDKSPKELKTLSDDIKALGKICTGAEKSLNAFCTTEIENYIANDDKTKLKDYSIEELSTVAETLTSIEKELDYSTNKQFEAKIGEFTEYHMKNDLKEHSPKELEAFIQLIDTVCDKLPNFKSSLNIAKAKAAEACLLHNKISLEASDAENVKHNIDRLEDFNQNCSWDFSDILNGEKSKLKKIQIRDEKESRTFNDVVYDTLEEAEAVKNETELFEKTLKDANNLSETLKYTKLLECEFKTQTVLNKLEEKEKKLIRHIEDMRSMTKRRSAFWKLLVALITTPVLAGIALMFNVVGIIIGLIVILAIWNWYNEERKECKEYNSHIAYRKSEIKEFESLFAVQNGHLRRR